MFSQRVNKHRIRTVVVGRCCFCCCRRWRQQNGVGAGYGSGVGVGYGSGVGFGGGVGFGVVGGGSVGVCGVGGGGVFVGIGGGVGVGIDGGVGVGIGGGVGVGSGVDGSDGDTAECFSFCAQYAECISDDLTNLLSATSRRNLGRMDLRSVGNIIPSLLCHYPK